MKAILRSGFLALAIMAPALPADAGPLELKRVIAEARRDCASAVAGGEITFSEDLVSNVDITGDGKFEQIINFSRFDCSSAIIYWSTGGGKVGIQCKVKRHVAGRGLTLKRRSNTIDDFADMIFSPPHAEQTGLKSADIQHVIDHESEVVDATKDDASKLALFLV